MGRISIKVNNINSIKLLTNNISCSCGFANANLPPEPAKPRIQSRGKPAVPATRVEIHERNFERLKIMLTLHGESVISGNAIDEETYCSLKPMREWSKRVLRKAKSDPSIEYVEEIKYFYQKYLCHL